MKTIRKRRKLPKDKKGNLAEHKPRRKIKKILETKRYFLQDIVQLPTPHNTTQYIIANHSSMFYDEEPEEEYDLMCPIYDFELKDILASPISAHEEKSEQEKHSLLPSTSEQSKDLTNISQNIS